MTDELRDQVMKRSGMVLHSIEAISASRQPLPPVYCGVYFLFEGDELVYIGQSVNIVQRIHAHEKIRHSGRDITSWAFQPCAPEDLRALEHLYIGIYRPPLNT
ncbi:MAG: GIY-YIG nuclease family protein [Gammaproteobacteria bacterium]|nr:GIY-YIG nuclease family protein [Gammaproteobacteria bacterium]